MAYDRADWHSGGNYPVDLPPENGGTHIGFFLTWAISHNLVGGLHMEDSKAALDAVKARQKTGRDFLFEQCDGKFWAEDLSPEGNAFAEAYYAEKTGPYFRDLLSTIGVGLPTIYHAEDSWGNYDKLAAVIDRRYINWKGRGTINDTRPWWRFWSK
jgi:hypothetical protein